MKRLFVSLGVALLTGCYDYDAALAFCRNDGGCRPVSEDAGETDAGNLDAGNTDAGHTDAGDVDAGQTDAGPSDAGPADLEPVFFTSTGWGWEFPFPAGPGLHSVVAISDQEAWAAGDDSSVLHWRNGVVTFTRHPPLSPDPDPRGLLVLRSGDGGVLLVGEGALRSSNGLGWSNATSFPYAIRSAELGSNGLPWVGAQWQGGSGRCAIVGAAIIEGPTAQCTSPGANMSDFVVGLDPAGWGLDSSGNVLRRGGDGGWTPIGSHPSGQYLRGDVLGLSSEEVLVVGQNAGSSALLQRDGGWLELTFDRMGAPEEWTCLERAPNQQRFLIAGRPGIHDCELGVPPTCSLDYRDPTSTLETLSHGPTAVFAVGDNGQLIRRGPDAGSWVTLHEGGLGTVNDVWVDPDGTLWAVTGAGYLLRRVPGGWDRMKVSAGPLTSLTRTDDGLLWVAGATSLGSYDPGSGTLVDAVLLEADGGTYSLTGGSEAVVSLSGTQPGNTWAAGAHVLLGYTGAGTWTAVPLARNGSDMFDLVWASDAGTAWAVGGFGTRIVLFFDGTRWVDRTPAGTDRLFSVWGPSGTEVFVAGEFSGHHFLSDGGVTPWSLASSLYLSGGMRADGGSVVFGTRGNQVWRSPNGLVPGTPLVTNAPRDRWTSRIRVFGSKVYVTGAREEINSFVLSLDAGL